MTRPAQDPRERTADSGRTYWDRKAPRHNLSMRLLGGPIPAMIDRVVQELRPTDRVLEVAAGTGLVTVPAAKALREVVATDDSGGMIEVLRSGVEQAGLRNVECLPRDIYSLGFEPESFDAVIATNVLHLVPDLPGALAALKAVLRPQGKLLAPTYCHDETLRSRLGPGPRRVAA
jgi:ubiquinone/menaquinone biosynthesis C-methylase UbiE